MRARPLAVAPSASGATDRTHTVPTTTERQVCAEAFGGVHAPPSSEPLAQCRWHMASTNADQATHARSTGRGVRVGVIDSGVDLNHPDITPNLDWRRRVRSCGPTTPPSSRG